MSPVTNSLVDDNHSQSSATLYHRYRQQRMRRDFISAIPSDHDPNDHQQSIVWCPPRSGESVARSGRFPLGWYADVPANSTLSGKTLVENGTGSRKGRWPTVRASKTAMARTTCPLPRRVACTRHLRPSQIQQRRSRWYRCQSIMPDVSPPETQQPESPKTRHADIAFPGPPPAQPFRLSRT